jgi:hypothetical protein
MYNFTAIHNIARILYLYLELDDSSLSSTLAPILGQYGIKPTEFITVLLMDRGSDFFLDVVVFSKLQLYHSGKYKIIYKTIPSNFLIRQLPSLRLLDVVKLFILHKFDINTCL